MKKTVIVCDRCDNTMQEGEGFSGGGEYLALVDCISTRVNIGFTDHDICLPCAITIMETIFKGTLLKCVKDILQGGNPMTDKKRMTVQELAESKLAQSYGEVESELSRNRQELAQLKQKLERNRFLTANKEELGEVRAAMKELQDLVDIIERRVNYALKITERRKNQFKP